MNSHFDNLHEIFKSIKNSSYNREYAWEIASAYIYEENQNIGFNEKLFDGFGFLFHFFLKEQFEVSDDYFKLLIDNLLKLGDDVIEVVEVKKVLYEKQLVELKSKYDKKIISKNIYEEQIEKYFN